MREGWEGAWLERHLIIASARACESQEGKKARSFHLTYNSTLLTPRPNPARRRPPSSSQVKIVGLQCRRLCGSCSAALNAVHLSPPPAAADHSLQLHNSHTGFVTAKDAHLAAVAVAVVRNSNSEAQ